MSHDKFILADSFINAVQVTS